jgi:threonine dehydratase
MNKVLDFNNIITAKNRVEKYIKNTPIIQNKDINKNLAAEIFFKMENQQITNSFKARGAFNAILSYKEKFGKFPEKISASSSGNHAQAIAFACKKFAISCSIHMIKAASKIKIEATKKFGAKVTLHEKRAAANKAARMEEKEENCFFIHPSQSNEVISGQGVAAFEALENLEKNNIFIDAIFTPCGGGGLASGSFLASQNFNKIENNYKIKNFTCEPQNANDAAISVRTGKVFNFSDTPNTIADGARTLGVSQNCFLYLKQLDGILEIPEEEIKSGQEELTKYLNQKIEPTSALAYLGAKKYLKESCKIKNPKILIIISGGNI